MVIRRAAEASESRLPPDTPPDARRTRSMSKRIAPEETMKMRPRVAPFCRPQNALGGTHSYGDTL
jgi:hypothetical protein